MTHIHALETFAQNNPVRRTAVLGAGFIGRRAVHRLARLAGHTPVVVVNRSLDRARDAWEYAGVDPATVLEASTAQEVAEAVEAGTPVVTDSVEAVASSGVIDLAVPATGSVAYGAHSIPVLLEAGIDVVSFNAEVDLLLAPTFERLADDNNCIYTLADGDQPTALIRVIEDARLYGYDPVGALNCKRHLNVHQTPESGAGYAKRDSTSPKMTTAFGDGTKMQIENAVLSNWTGWAPVARGGVGVETMLDTAAADIMKAVETEGFVDFTLGGNFGAGVGVVFKLTDPDADALQMRFLKMGEGPYYFLFRPYHLVSFELGRTVAQVACERRPLARTVGTRVADVIALAKRDVPAGTALDGIGGFDCYGLTDTAEGAKGFLPMTLVEFATLNEPIATGQPIPLSAVSLDETAAAVVLWRSQHAA